MAKKSVVLRNEKRIALVEKFRSKRDMLKKQIQDPKRTSGERYLSQEALARLPRNSSPTRVRSRCWRTGRPRGVFKRFGLCRHEIRRIGMEGLIPGLRKSSW